jgi:succinate dehydrogenase / fumarate reductase cytochrome b subunit
MAKQAEIGEIEPHGLTQPSDLTNSGFIECQLSLEISMLFFRKERSEAQGTACGWRPGPLRHARGLDRNGFGLGAVVEHIRMNTMAETKAPAARPLSPHLQIYRPMLTMMMSIVHRITGVGLYFGTLLLVWWVIAAASPNAYAKFEWFAGSIVGRLILFGYTWALIHHMLGGIRHLIWDTGRGFGPSEREWLAAANLIGSIAVTVVLWIVGLLAMG